MSLCDSAPLEEYSLLENGISSQSGDRELDQIIRELASEASHNSGLGWSELGAMGLRPDLQQLFVSALRSVFTDWILPDIFYPANLAGNAG